MSIYKDSILKINERYKIQEVSHFNKKLAYMIGQHCVLKQIINSTASVSFTGRMCTVPVRSLVSITGYTPKSVSNKNADGFVVIAQNNQGIPVGTAYLDPIEVTNDFFKVIVNMKEITIPLDIVCSLVKNKRLEKPIVNSVASKNTRVPDVVVETLVETVAPHSNRKDIEEIPLPILRLLPGVNLVEVRNTILNQKEVYSDYEGNVFESLAEVDKANTRIRHRLLTERLIDTITENLTKQSETVRNNH